MAAALRNIEVIESENLIKNSDMMGTYMYRRLVEVLQERHASVEYISGGLGLLASISVIKNRHTREQYPGGSRGPALRRLEQSVLSKGLSLRIGSNINVTPPLTITRKLVDEIVDILDQSFSEMEREFPPEA
jgi:adenosylmethionine-8-amino-7-oxononanoate aminotransferase